MKYENQLIIFDNKDKSIISRYTKGIFVIKFKGKYTYCKICNRLESENKI